MIDIIFVFLSTLLLMYMQFDMMLYYNAIMNQEEEVKRENYGKMQQYPEVSDFFCPTCGRHFSNYQHCHRHAEVRNHNKSFVFCNYSFKGLPRCHRSSTYYLLVSWHVASWKRTIFLEVVVLQDANGEWKSLIVVSFSLGHSLGFSIRYRYRWFFESSCFVWFMWRAPWHECSCVLGYSNRAGCCLRLFSSSFCWCVVMIAFPLQSKCETRFKMPGTPISRTTALLATLAEVQVRFW